MTSFVWAASFTLTAQTNPSKKSMESKSGQAFGIDELREQLRKSGKPYLPFLNVPSMRMGVYSLGAGAEDKQSPHDEDEVYYVLKGQATLHVDTEEYPVKEGSLIFVAAHVTHKFHDITQPIEVLVFFSAAPAQKH